MYEASFKLRHECPYRALSERFPGVTIREWHHHDCQILELRSTATDDDLVAAVEDIGTVLQTTTDGDGMTVIAQACECPLDGSIIERFQAHNCVYTPPTVYRDGWEHYTVIGFEESDIHGLLQDLDESRDIDVLSKTAIEKRRLPHSTLFSVDRLFGDLTDRQLEALRIALDQGYFDQPRGASVAELATETNVSRATYEEHLRKAQNKLISNLEQFVRLLTDPGSRDKLAQARDSARAAEGD